MGASELDLLFPELNDLQARDALRLQSAAQQLDGDRLKYGTGRTPFGASLDDLLSHLFVLFTFGALYAWLWRRPARRILTPSEQLVDNIRSIIRWAAHRQCAVINVKPTRTTGPNGRARLKRFGELFVLDFGPDLPSQTYFAARNDVSIDERRPAGAWHTEATLHWPGQTWDIRLEQSDLAYFDTEAVTPEMANAASS